VRLDGAPGYRSLRKDRKVRSRFNGYRMLANLDEGWSFTYPVEGAALLSQIKSYFATQIVFRKHLTSFAT
jgi:hypothetical protein